MKNLELINFQVSELSVQEMVEIEGGNIFAAIWKGVKDFAEGLWEGFQEGWKFVK